MTDDFVSPGASSPGGAPAPKFEGDLIERLLQAIGYTQANVAATGDLAPPQSLLDIINELRAALRGSRVPPQADVPDPSSYELLRDAIEENLQEFIHEEDIAEEAIFVGAIEQASVEIKRLRASPETCTVCGGVGLLRIAALESELQRLRAARVPPEPTPPTLDALRRMLDRYSCAIQDMVHHGTHSSISDAASHRRDVVLAEIFFAYEQALRSGSATTTPEPQPEFPDPIVEHVKHLREISQCPASLTLERHLSKLAEFAYGVPLTAVGGLPSSSPAESPTELARLLDEMEHAYAVRKSTCGGGGETSMGPQGLFCELPMGHSGKHAAHIGHRNQYPRVEWGGRTPEEGR